jgi:hypothetical protein
MRPIFLTLSLLLLFAGNANTVTNEPDIPVIRGDDIGCLISLHATVHDGLPTT